MTAITHPIDGGELRLARARAGITMKDIAGLIHVDEATVSRMERGISPLIRLDDRQARAWAGHVGLDPDRMPRPAPEQVRGSVIRDRRKTLGWSYRRLAAEAGVNPVVLNRYDTGNKPTASMRADNLQAVAAALSTTMEDLAGYAPPTTPDPRDMPPADWTGTPIAWHLARLHMTQSALAQACGHPLQNVGALARGAKTAARAHAGVILDIAAILDVPAGTLL